MTASERRRLTASERRRLTASEGRRLTASERRRLTVSKETIQQLLKKYLILINYHIIVYKNRCQNTIHIAL